MKKKHVLGIESSCDETAISIVREDKEIVAHALATQINTHQKFGGVVPEIAARAHAEKLQPLLKACMHDVKMNYADIDAVAATSGPGLIGGVMIGMVAGKSIASVLQKPFIAINHLEAHVLTPRLVDDVPFPYLALLVSGGHTQILAVYGVDKMEVLGQTLDDALGEAFDKSAKMMGLPYPGGPHMERLASMVKDPNEACTRFDLPRPMKGKPNCDFSFSGLKTAMRTAIDKLPAGEISEKDGADMAHAFHVCVADVLIDRLTRAFDVFEQKTGAPAKRLCLVGGVAANRFLYGALQNFADRQDAKLFAPPVKLCTDNGAMIAWNGMERLQIGLTDPLDFKARPRWPLGER